MSIRLEVKIAPFPIDALCGCGLERPPPPPSTATVLCRTKSRPCRDHDLVVTCLIVTSSPQRLTFPEEDPRNRYHSNANESEQASRPVDTKPFVDLNDEKWKRGAQRKSYETVGSYRRCRIRHQVRVHEIGHAR